MSNTIVGAGVVGSEAGAVSRFGSGSATLVFRLSVTMKKNDARSGKVAEF
jgi:hypothetical protein